MPATFKIEIDDRDLRRKTDTILRFLPVSKLLYAIGARHLRWINENFRTEGAAPRSGTSGWFPLSPNTIAARRGRGRGAKILQDTGRLRMSFAVDARALAGEVEVGTSDQRAPWHHLGTRPYVIRPKKPGGILAFKGAGPSGKSGFWRFAKMVHHPGLRARPLIPQEPVARDMAVEEINALFNKAMEMARGGG
jgi:phage gpG-like protein